MRVSFAFCQSSCVEGGHTVRSSVVCAARCKIPWTIATFITFKQTAGQQAQLSQPPFPVSCLFANFSQTRIIQFFSYMLQHTISLELRRLDRHLSGRCHSKHLYIALCFLFQKEKKTPNQPPLCMHCIALHCIAFHSILLRINLLSFIYHLFIFSTLFIIQLYKPMPNTKLFINQIPSSTSFSHRL